MWKSYRKRAQNRDESQIVMQLEHSTCRSFIEHRKPLGIFNQVDNKGTSSKTGVFGKGYIALSRETTFRGLSIMHFDRVAFVVDQQAVRECIRLENIWNGYLHEWQIRRMEEY